MSRRPGEGRAAAGASGRLPGPISRLPDEVVAQIKSSTAITSLIGVVLELIKNSLDAEADRIEATVDFGRGGCSIDDNGLGVAPAEFREEGGLGKLYYTSKYHAQGACLGRNGAFLASLATVSLLTVTSHHHEHRSHNTVVFHRSKAIDRQLPALPRHLISHERHGTRVTVRNLFGDLPVRVKQRAVAAEQKPELNRLWEILRREIVSLLLSWGRPISLRIKDTNNQTILKINSPVEKSSLSTLPTTPKPRSASTQLMLNVLTQADLVLADEWAAWVSVSASTPRISIRGAISLEPAPTKRTQFISFGLRPLSAEAGHNELFDEVNRIFTLSSFGMIEDDADIDETEKLRRESDNRFKHDGYSTRQLKGRKGVDRYPKFHLRISLTDDTDTTPASPEVLDDESDLQAVVEVLGAMVIQWLALHHFRPRRKSTKRARPNIASTAASEVEKRQQISAPSQHLREKPQSIPTILSLRPNTSSPMDKKRKATGSAGTLPGSARVQKLPFTSWSRIKSAKDNVYDELWSSSRTLKQKGNGLPLLAAGTLSDNDESSTHFIMDHIDPGVLRAPPSHAADFQAHLVPEDFEDPDPDAHDETTTWTDPTTKRKFLLNARTGYIISRELSDPRLAPEAAESASTLADFNKSLRLRPSSLSEKNTPWLDGLLENWDNPVFHPTSSSIQRAALEDFQWEHGLPNELKHQSCARIDWNTVFNGVSLTENNKLSKQGLREAEVLAQVDKKFVLVKMRNASKASTGPEILILIDQHAADERIRVEALLAELCAPSSESNHSQYRSKLGHTSQIPFSALEKPLEFDVSLHERELFVTHAARFATWGILYGISSSRNISSRSDRVQAILSVTALPSGIAERCKTDPKLLISLLRSTVWTYAESSSLPPLTTSNEKSNGDGSSPPPWLQRLSTCPQGLVDMINSRACRSAIMFNDDLTLEECNALVQKLAKCVFPFMCAHGRPSMIPLVDLGKARDKEAEEPRRGFGLQSAGSTKEESFVDAWKKWKRH